MLTPPELEDPRQYDYEYGDQEEMIYKKNALNAYHYNFYNALKVIVGELNVEFQFVADSRLDITNKSGQVATALQQVNTAKQSVDQSKNHIDQQKQAIDTTAGQVNSDAQQVASDRQVVAQDKQATTASAAAASSSASDALTAKQQAEALYGDLDAINTAKTQSQQAATTASQQRALAVTARQGAEQALADALQAAADANVDIDAAIAALVDSSPGALDTLNELAAALGDDPNFSTTMLNALAGKVPLTGADLGSNELKANLTHNNGYFYVGPYNSSYGDTQLRVWWSSASNILNMGGAQLGNVSVRNGDVIGRKPITNMELVGEIANPETVFALREGGKSPAITNDAHTARATGTYYGLSAANSPRGNGHYFWSQYGGDYNKFLFIDQTSGNRLFVGGSHGGVWSTPAEVWTTENLNLSAITTDLYVDKPRPWLTLKSITTGDSGVDQAAGVTLGESTGAALHITYTGDGRGHIGMGTIDANTGIPANEAMGLYYQNPDVDFFGDIKLPESVTLKGGVSGLVIGNSTYGEVAIGNRNANYTHYFSSAGSHYFYGTVRAQEGFNGDGSSVTNVNAAQLSGQSRSVNDDANTVAGRDSAGDIRARLFRSTYTPTNSNIAVIYTSTKTDGTDFMRPSTPAQVRAALDLDDLGAITGSNSRGRYYLYPDGRLVMQCGVKTFTQDPSSYRYLLCKVTLPYTPLGSAEHYVTATPSSDASDYSSGASPLDVAPPLAKPGRVSSGTVVEVRVANISKSNHSSGATAKASILVESRWK
ncbi:hypothetical protein HALA3H3_790057 [Halomonas sp. A3H3]|uniref:hypothetical protein n=1 Tax=Halomonas sp. A3H3 TaxID=1346287 RepID=UPI00038C8628|nr:hypothetical protein [Halomonas sp. A3H3]CDG54578.1 hypothetical protein HALA3H3_790057 [Halomonas sp. A3H3]